MFCFSLFGAGFLTACEIFVSCHIAYPTRIMMVMMMMMIKIQNNNTKTVFIVLPSWQRHCESSLDEDMELLLQCSVIMHGGSEVIH